MGLHTAACSTQRSRASGCSSYRIATVTVSVNSSAGSRSSASRRGRDVPVRHFHMCAQVPRGHPGDRRSLYMCLQFPRFVFITELRDVFCRACSGIRAVYDVAYLCKGCGCVRRTQMGGLYTHRVSVQYMCACIPFRPNRRASPFKCPLELQRRRIYCTYDSSTAQ